MNLTMAATALSYSIMSGTPSMGISKEAKFADEQADIGRNQIFLSSTIGYRALIADLKRLAQECAVPTWDGYDASAVDSLAIDAAAAFIRSLGIGFPKPTISVEPDGQFAFEWYHSPKRTLSISVSPGRLLHYSALLGTTSQFGTEAFLGDLPQNLRELVRRVHQA